MIKRNRAKMSNQNRIVLDHLWNIGPLTPLSALVNYGVARLAARVEELKQIGYNIVTTLKTINHKRYASYELRSV